jgi:hypothetical protein
VAEEVVLYEPEIYPPLEEVSADPFEDVPEEMIVSAAHDHTEPVPVFTPQFDSSPRYDFAPRQEAAPASLPEPAPFTEIAPPIFAQAETPAPGKVKLLKFSTAGLAAGLTVFLAFIFFGDKIIRSSSDISSVAAAPSETKAKPSVQQIKKQAAVTAATPAPQPSSTPAPTPEPTQAPTPEPTPAPQQAKQAETAPPPVDAQQSTAGGEGAGRGLRPAGRERGAAQARHLVPRDGRELQRPRRGQPFRGAAARQRCGPGFCHRRFVIAPRTNSELELRSPLSQSLRR